MQNIQNLIDKACRALDAEIKAVREKPSSDVLFNGVKAKAQPEDGVDYQFESHQQAIRFAEEIRALIDEKELTIHPISYENQELVLRYPDDQGDTISECHVEWENDFILKKTLEEMERIDSEDDAIRKRVENLFNPPDGASLRRFHCPRWPSE